MMIESPNEYEGQSSAPTEQDVIQLYQIFLEREPESPEVVENHLRNSKTIMDLVRRFVNSPEFIKIFHDKHFKDMGSTCQHEDGGNSKLIKYFSNLRKLNEICAYYEEYASDKTKNIIGMLTKNDRAIYYWYAHQHMTGDIIDCGCLFGASTQALLEATQDKQEKIIIKVFDWFKIDESISSFIQKNIHRTEKPGGDFRRYFDANMAPYYTRLEVYPGNIASIDYQQRSPIYLLCLDCCKSVEATDAIVRRFYSSLIGSRSIVIHQDYNHEWQPYIHIIQELFSDFFKMILDGEKHSSVFLCTNSISHQDILDRIGNDTSWFYERERNIRLLDRAIENAIFEFSKMAIECAKCVYLAILGDKDAASSCFISLKERYGARYKARLKEVEPFIMQ